MTELTIDVTRAIEARIAKAVGARAEQVRAAVALLDEGATVPFIARYRKEATGGLDDTQLRDLQEQLIYQRELEERRSAILEALTQSGKLTVRPTPSNASKTCICPISPSAGPAHRSPARRALRPWPTSFRQIRRSTRRPRRPLS